MGTSVAETTSPNPSKVIRATERRVRNQRAATGLNATARTTAMANATTDRGTSPMKVRSGGLPTALSHGRHPLACRSRVQLFASAGHQTRVAGASNPVPINGRAMSHDAPPPNQTVIRAASHVRGSQVQSAGWPRSGRHSGCRSPGSGLAALERESAEARPKCVSAGGVGLALPPGTWIAQDQSKSLAMAIDIPLHRCHAFRCSEDLGREKLPLTESTCIEADASSDRERSRYAGRRRGPPRASGVYLGLSHPNQQVEVVHERLAENVGIITAQIA